MHPEPLADYIPLIRLPLAPPPNHPQRVAVAVRPPLPRDQVQSVAGVRQNKHQDKHVESDDQTRALQDIIANAMKGVEANRWVSSDEAQLWVRIFKVHMCHNVTTPDKWTVEHQDFVKYITRE